MDTGSQACSPHVRKGLKACRVAPPVELGYSRPGRGYIPAVQVEDQATWGSGNSLRWAHKWGTGDRQVSGGH